MEININEIGDSVVFTGPPVNFLNELQNMLEEIGYHSTSRLDVVPEDCTEGIEFDHDLIPTNEPEQPPKLAVAPPGALPFKPENPDPDSDSDDLLSEITDLMDSIDETLEETDDDD